MIRSAKLMQVLIGISNVKQLAKLIAFLIVLNAMTSSLAIRQSEFRPRYQNFISNVCIAWIQKIQVRDRPPKFTDDCIPCNKQFQYYIAFIGHYGQIQVNLWYNLNFHRPNKVFNPPYCFIVLWLIKQLQLKIKIILNQTQWAKHKLVAARKIQAQIPNSQQQCNQKMKQPQQGGQLPKKILHESRLLQSNTLKDIFKCHKVAVPVLNNEVTSTISSINPMKMPQNYDKGQYRSDYYRFENTGVVYNGEWKDEVPHGFGHNYYPNESYYEGTFIQGVPHGFGRFVNVNGDYYEGEIKYGRANGVGVYENKHVSYRGHFKDNQKHGKGVEKTGSSYFEGMFEYDQKVEGLLKYGDATYEGCFQDNTFNGKGKLTNDKGVYYGNFKDGLQHGYGEQSWKDGSIYRGYFKNGVRDGQGEFYNSKNASIARGLWKDGTLNGAGEYLEPSGVKHRCIWQNSKIRALSQ